MIDFTKAEIGQKVTCYLQGKGRIIKIEDNGVTVSFGDHNTSDYTKNGRLKVGYTPTLMVGHLDLPKIDQGKLPKQKPKPLEFDGTPKWAYVSYGTYTDAELRGRRHVVAGNSHTKWCAITEGNSNTESSSTAHWKYAWELGDA